MPSEEELKDPNKEHRKGVLEKPLEELELDIPTYHLLMDGKLTGVEKIRDLVRLGRAELKAKLIWGHIEGEVENAIAVIEQSLKKLFGLSLGMDDEDIEKYLESGPDAPPQMYYTITGMMKDIPKGAAGTGFDDNDDDDDSA